LATATLDSATGSLVLDGFKVFPLILSDGPPRGGTTPPPQGRDCTLIISTPP
jgi:hypothetical protein